MKKVLLVVCVLALLSTAAAYASDSQWGISIKAVTATYGGNTVTQVGVGNNTDTATSGFANETGGLPLVREHTTAYGDAANYDSFHDVPLDTVGPQSYAWDLKIGMKGSDLAGVRIYIWNNKTPQGAKYGEINHSLAFAFQKKVGETYQTLAWFCDASLQAQATGLFGDNAAGTWWNTTDLIKTSAAWAPSSTQTTGVIVTQDLVAANDYASLADYRLIAETVPVPEPGSLMALGSGLVGLAGFAIRRRR